MFHLKALGWREFVVKVGRKLFPKAGVFATHETEGHVLCYSRGRRPETAGRWALICSSS